MDRSAVLARRYLAELLLRPSFAFVLALQVAVAVAVLSILAPLSPFLDARATSRSTDRSLVLVLVGGEDAVATSLLARALAARKEVARVHHAPTLEEALAAPGRKDAVVVLPAAGGGAVRLLVPREGALAPLAASAVRAAIADAGPAERRGRVLAGEGLAIGSLGIADDYGTWEVPPLLVDAVLLFLVPFLALFPALAVALLTTSLVREEFEGRTVEGLVMAGAGAARVAAGLAAPATLLAAAASSLALALSSRLFPLPGVAALALLSAATAFLLSGVGAAAAAATRGGEAATSAVMVAAAALAAASVLGRALSPLSLAPALGAGPVPAREVALCAALLAALGLAAWHAFCRAFDALADG